MKNVYLLSGMIVLGSVAGLNAMEQGRPAIYQIIDSLVHKYKGPYYYHKSDWPAIFKMLDEFKDVISVNEYLFRTGNIGAGFNFSPLLAVAVEENNLLVAKELLEKYHANPNAENLKITGEELLKKHGANAKNRQIIGIELFKKYSDNPNVELFEKNDLSKTGWTALRSACSNLDVPMVKLLLKHGASPNVKHDNTNIIEMVEEKKKETLKTRNIKEAKKAPLERVINFV